MCMNKWIIYAIAQNTWATLESQFYFSLELFLQPGAKITKN